MISDNFVEHSFHIYTIFGTEIVFNLSVCVLFERSQSIWWWRWMPYCFRTTLLLQFQTFLFLLSHRHPFPYRQHCSIDLIWFNWISIHYYQLIGVWLQHRFFNIFFAFFVRLKLDYQRGCARLRSKITIHYTPNRICRTI